MKTMTIIETFQDKKLLGHYFKNLKTWSVWITVLKAVFSIPFTDEDWLNWKKVAGDRPLPLAVRELWGIAARRLGKTTIMAALACYLAVFKDWSKYLSPGERGYVICVANDRKQSGELFQRIKHTFTLPFFRQLVERETFDELTLTNGIVIAVKTADFRSIRGLTIVAALLDEAAFYRIEGASPFAEILTAIRPSMATIPESLLIVFSSPYMKSGPLWINYQKYYGKDDPHILVIQGSTETFNPTLDKDFIKRQIEADPEAGKAEWLGHFRDDLETFIDNLMLGFVTILGRLELPPVKGILYFLFADPSGGKSDSFTAGISHRESTGLVVLDAIREWKPPFKPQTVVKEITALAGEYCIKTVTTDRYAGEWVAQAFRDAGLQHKPSALNKSELYLELLPKITGHRIELLDHPKMLTQLRGLERRTRSGGHDLVDHGPGGHDDLSNVCAGAAWLASQEKRGGVAMMSDTYVYDCQGHKAGERDSDDLQERSRHSWKCEPDNSPPRVKIMMSNLPKK